MLTFQLFLEYPLVWFTSDTTGGWREFVSSIEKQGLHFRGIRLDKICDNNLRIAELYDMCIIGGADGFVMPTRAVTYSELAAFLGF